MLWSLLESTLNNTGYVARTAEMSIADIAFYNDAMGLKWAKYDFTPYPNIQRLMTSIEAVPAVQEINAIVMELAQQFMNDA